MEGNGKEEGKFPSFGWADIVGGIVWTVLVFPWAPHEQCEKIFTPTLSGNTGGKGCVLHFSLLALFRISSHPPFQLLLVHKPPPPSPSRLPLLLHQVSLPWLPSFFLLIGLYCLLATLLCWSWFFELLPFWHIPGCLQSRSCVFLIFFEGWERRAVER